SAPSVAAPPASPPQEPAPQLPSAPLVASSPVPSAPSLEPPPQPTTARPKAPAAMPISVFLSAEFMDAYLPKYPIEWGIAVYAMQQMLPASRPIRFASSR